MHYRFSASLAQAVALSTSISFITPSHIKRAANTLADRLANERVEQDNLDMILSWDNMSHGKLQDECDFINSKDRGRIGEGS
jgi:hypothetical protein